MGDGSDGSRPPQTSTPFATDTGRFSIMCISPQPWDSDLPTNRQQIMRRAAARGHEVLFVESGSFVFRDPGEFLRHPLAEARSRLVGRAAAPGIRVSPPSA